MAQISIDKGHLSALTGKIVVVTGEFVSKPTLENTDIL